MSQYLGPGRNKPCNEVSMLIRIILTRILTVSTQLTAWFTGLLLKTINIFSRSVNLLRLEKDGTLRETFSNINNTKNFGNFPNDGQLTPPPPAAHFLVASV